ncbi:MAG: glycoside hydrolase 43 family protein [Muribaculaceae bacterium]|nr:glycoside hydrolase 43 family protein [Muribaculaceae bacterium]
MKRIFALLLLVLPLLAGAGETFRNPVINADVPDISVCKVADTYYMISTTMHLMPGGPIMKSKDMVNWETIGYVFDRIDDGDRYDLLNGQTVYGQGQWASSIRYHMGKFYVWFSANGAPGKGFVFCADNPEGPWQLLARPPHMHDASLLFDEDGRRYLFTSGGGCTVVELDKNFNPLAGGLNKKVVDASTDPEEKTALLEGSSVIKHNGKYYICMISMKWGAQGRVRREVCYRANNIEGPYQKKIILETPFESYGGVGQGCLVGDDQSDQGWWALIFQDRGGIGRVPCALPVTWVEGWPMVGEYTGVINNAIADDPADNPSGNPLLDRRNYRTPSDLSKRHPDVAGLIGSDEFELLPINENGGYHARNGMNLYWQWNHNPIDEAWSLQERPGHLRLKTARVVDNMQVAPNTLTQRMAGPTCSGSVKIDVTNMKDGDICGLAAYNGDSGVLRVVKKGGKHYLQLTEEKSVFKQPRNIEKVDVNVMAEIPLKFKNKKEQNVFLQINGDFNPGRDMASFAYSMDGENWTDFDQEIPMRFDYMRHFMGTKFALFNYATKQTGGHVDIDWFHFQN